MLAKSTCTIKTSTETFRCQIQIPDRDPNVATPAWIIQTKARPQDILVLSEVRKQNFTL